MGNPHYGTLGDVWKHLCLAEVLAAAPASAYFESHAGAARYPLRHDAGRRLGILHILEQRSRSRAVDGAALLNLVDDESYPGSPAIAMRLLGSRASYLFIDIDLGALHSVAAEARALGLAPAMACVDAAPVMARALARLQGREARQTCVLIDPFVAFRADGEGANGIELFCAAAERGARALLWFGYNSPNRRLYTWGVLRRALRKHPGLRDIGLWSGELMLKGWRDIPLDVYEGLRGAVVVGAGLEPAVADRCEAIGQGLVGLYRGVEIVPGLDCALQIDVDSRPGL